MKKKILFLVLIFGLLVMVGANSALARGWFSNGSELNSEELVNKHQEMFLKKANLLGITPEAMKEYWSQGKDLREIANEMGLSLEDLEIKMKEKRESQMRERMSFLVEKGLITQEQAEKRLNFENQGVFSRGFGKNRGLETRKSCLEECPRKMNFGEINN